jgi:hypothetical protein
LSCSRVSSPTLAWRLASSWLASKDRGS